jgi:hypothetical protein
MGETARRRCCTDRVGQLPILSRFFLRWWVYLGGSRWPRSPRKTPRVLRKAIFVAVPIRRIAQAPLVAPGSFFTLFTFHFSSILPDARLVELSQSTDSVAPSRFIRIARGLFEAVRAVHECGFV